MARREEIERKPTVVSPKPPSIPPENLATDSLVQARYLAEAYDQEDAARRRAQIRQARLGLEQIGAVAEA